MGLLFLKDFSSIFFKSQNRIFDQKQKKLKIISRLVCRCVLILIYCRTAHEEMCFM